MYQGERVICAERVQDLVGGERLRRMGTRRGNLKQRALAMAEVAGIKVRGNINVEVQFGCDPTAFSEVLIG